MCIFDNFSFEKKGTFGQKMAKNDTLHSGRLDCNRIYRPRPEYQKRLKCPRLQLRTFDSFLLYYKGQGLQILLQPSLLDSYDIPGQKLKTEKLFKMLYVDINSLECGKTHYSKLKKFTKWLKTPLQLFSDLTRLL